MEIKKFWKVEFRGHFLFYMKFYFLLVKLQEMVLALNHLIGLFFFNQREQVLVHVFIPTRMSKSISVQVSRKVSS